MRHGLQTIVISTSEQAQAMLDHLKACEESAKADDYASERKKPIKSLSCTCCGDGLDGRDWWNQEPGYGLCDRCVSYCHAPTEPGEESSTYGVCGVHYLIPKSERNNPPLVEDRGVALYGMDARLRIEYDGYVYWKGRQIEHFSGHYLEESEQTREVARDLIRRCETLESRGEEVNTTSVIWNWKESEAAQ
jgi:hypothetical protein